MPTRGAQSAAKFDLGFSDDEDDGGQPESSKAETVHDLVNQRRDPAMVLGGSSSRLRPSSSFQLGGGIDPLESLLKKEKEQPDDDDDNADEFDREFRKLAGQSLGEQVFAATAPAEVLRDQASSVSRRSRDEAEDLPLPPDSRGPDPDLEDIVGEILGENVSDTKPVPSGKSTLRRAQTEPLEDSTPMARRETPDPRDARDFGRGVGSRMRPEMSPSGGSDAALSERFQESEGRVPEGALEVELTARPKRSLGKAKASPASSRVMTPGLDPEENLGATPPRPPRDFSFRREDDRQVAQPSEPAGSPPRSRVSEGAQSELAHPQPSRASEKSGSASRLVPPSGPKAVHQAPAKAASVASGSSHGQGPAPATKGAAQARTDAYGMPAERPRVPEDSQVRNQQAAAASIAALLAEQEAARRLPTLSGDRGPPGDGDGTPPSQRELSFVVEGATSGQGFSAMPPAANAPDLLLQLAQAKAKVRHLELQLEDSEQRWQRRFEDAKRQEDASHARMELQCQYLQSELDRCKEVQASEMRHFLEQKRMLSQGHQTEKEEAVREERRKVQMEIDKVKADHRLEVEELKRQNERAIAIVKQQAEVEAENLRRAQTGEHHLTKLVEQVQGSVAEVERLSKRVDSDKTMEWSVRERQIEARERNARDMEAQLSRQSKEVEEQRRRLSDLVTNLQNCQEEDTSVLASERERLQAEHQRLLELQQSVREADRNNKEALKHAWAQVEEDRRVLQQEQLRFDSEQAARKEELEMQERQLKSETERLKTLHQQIEVARQSAARRIRETESTVANERRCLMNDLEAFEEKKRFHSSEAMKLENDRRQLQEDKSNFESELHSVGLMAQELERRSEEIRVLHGEAAEARSELHLLRGQLQEERSAQGTEMERLRTMQSLIEQQRLQLLQTENQLRLQGVEDIDLQVTGQGHFPNDLPSLGNAQEAMNRWTTDWLEPREVSGPIPGPATRRPATISSLGGSDFQIRSKLQRSRKGSGEMQTYLLQSAAFLQEAQRAPPAIQAGATRPPSITSSDMLEDVGSSQSSGDI